MNPETVVTILCGLAILVGVAGTVIPVLPGSILIGLSLLAWAIWGGAGTTGWVVFGIGMVFVLAGNGGQRGADRPQTQTAQHSQPLVVAGLVLGVVGMFIIPVVGLFVGFAAGLLLSELHRTRAFGTAAASSWAALKATGLGMIVEFGLACLAGSTWVIGLWVSAAA